MQLFAFGETMYIDAALEEKAVNLVHGLSGGFELVFTSLILQSATGGEINDSGRDNDGQKRQRTDGKNEFGREFHNSED